MTEPISSVLDALFVGYLLDGILPELSSGDPPELQEAYRAATEALERDPNDVQAHFMRGVVCQSKRCYEAALADFAEVLRANPRHARAWLLTGEVLTNLGEYDKAKLARQTALAIDPGVG
jgi:tetratricopeptide (TPR) repeat protein